jgi:hypothetical protein
MRSVKQTLESVPTVRNVVVQNLDLGLFRLGEPRVEDEGDGRVLLDRRFLPHPSAGVISFDVEVPATVQDRLGFTTPSVVGEHFSVRIHFTDLFPVLYVIPRDQSARSPSMAVVLVREFLLDELSRRDPVVELRVLGPSPFWADFAVRAAPTGAPILSVVGVEVTRVAQRLSYDDMFFDYDPAVYGNDEEALDAVLGLIRVELALYYELQKQSQERLYKWVGVSNNVESLVALHQATGFKVSVTRWLRAGKLSRQLALQIIQVESETRRDQQIGARELREVYQGFSLSAFREDVEGTLAEQTAADYPGAKELVAMLDARRIQDVNLAALVASSTVGGVVGALITAIAGS